MTSPAWLSDTLAGVMILVAGYCLGRLAISVRLRRPTDRGVDAVHVLMGIAMVGMLVPGLRVLGAAGWEIVFGAAIAWFSWRWLRTLGRGTASAVRWHHLQHVVGCGAMLYMLAAVAVSAAAAGGAVAAVGRGMSGSTGIPVLAFAFVLALGGFVIWTVDRLASLPPVLALAGRKASGSPSASVAASSALYATQSAAPQADTADPPRQPALAGRNRAAPLSPRLAACCDIVMGLTMAYMLIIMH